jgi:tRNA threonylcarbamoyladenosine biosynthesis protein TsaE
MKEEIHVCSTPEESFALGELLGSGLKGGDVVLLYGGLGAGKTLLTKGIINSLGYDVDEVTSPSFTLVNQYRTDRFDVYHIDLWRLESSNDPGAAVGLADILENENVVLLIEWADHLAETSFRGRVIRIEIIGDGDEPRKITVASEGK